MFTTWASPDADSVAEVRRLLARNLAVLDVPPPVIADAELVIGELLVNSIRHARPLASGRIEVTWDVTATAVALRVTDGGSSDQPQVRPHSSTNTSGRGLRIVDAVSRLWGTTCDDASCTVWAELALGSRTTGTTSETAARAGQSVEPSLAPNLH